MRLLIGGKHTIIDDADKALIAGHRWWLRRAYRSQDRIYVYTQINGKTTYLHRLLLNASPGQIVDHINGNGLDNRRSNLRLANTKLNCANSRRARPESGFRGVYRTGPESYCARIWADHKSRNIGTFRTATDAARAYDAQALIEFGQFAQTNFANSGSN